MNFEKYLFRTAINGWSIAKYTDCKRVKIVAEHSDYADDGEITFDSKEDYEKWIDSVVDDETAIYNQYRAVSLVLDALRK